MPHSREMVPRLTLDIRVVPLMSHISRSPVDLFCQRISRLPSPLKSPLATIFHALAIVPKLTSAIRVVPLMSHTDRRPVASFCNRRSVSPSPSKSAAETISDCIGTLGRVADPLCSPRSMYQTVHCPV